MKIDNPNIYQTHEKIEDKLFFENNFKVLEIFI